MLLRACDGLAACGDGMSSLLRLTATCSHKLNLPLL